MKQLSNFKKLNRSDQRKMVTEFYKNKEFRVMLKNAGLKSISNVLTSAGSSSSVVLDEPEFYYRTTNIQQFYGDSDTITFPSTGYQGTNFFGLLNLDLVLFFFNFRDQLHYLLELMHLLFTGFFC